MTDETDRNQRLVNVILDERTLVRRRPEVEHERLVAIEDLIENNRFVPVGDYQGPYILHVRVEGQRLIFGIHTESDRPLGEIVLLLTPLRQIVRDYFIICESYFDSIRNAPPHKIEAIDMGRRGLHDEGSRMLRERLAGMVEIDFATARRLFTLICVLHARG
jgi:uncharacterized protein (UPF0262 family)